MNYDTGSIAILIAVIALVFAWNGRPKKTEVREKPKRSFQYRVMVLPDWKAILQEITETQTFDEALKITEKRIAALGRIKSSPDGVFTTAEENHGLLGSSHAFTIFSDDRSGLSMIFHENSKRFVDDIAATGYLIADRSYFEQDHHFPHDPKKPNLFADKLIVAPDYISFIWTGPIGEANEKSFLVNDIDFQAIVKELKSRADKRDGSYLRSSDRIPKEISGCEQVNEEHPSAWEMFIFKGKYAEVRIQMKAFEKLEEIEE